jgi:23S rRNA-/tRNA-specific pseudouridylate synthase
MADRLFLHAQELVITHPTDNNRLTFLSTIKPF